MSDRECGLGHHLEAFDRPRPLVHDEPVHGARRVQHELERLAARFGRLLLRPEADGLGGDDRDGRRDARQHERAVRLGARFHAWPERDSKRSSHRGGARTTASAIGVPALVRTRPRITWPTSSRTSPRSTTRAPAHRQLHARLRVARRGHAEHVLARRHVLDREAAVGGRLGPERRPAGAARARPRGRRSATRPPIGRSFASSSRPTTRAPGRRTRSTRASVRRSTATLGRDRGRVAGRARDDVIDAAADPSPLSSNAPRSSTRSVGLQPPGAVAATTRRRAPACRPRRARSRDGARREDDEVDPAAGAYGGARRDAPAPPARQHVVPSVRETLQREASVRVRARGHATRVRHVRHPDRAALPGGDAHVRDGLAAVAVADGAFDRRRPR